MGVKFLIIALVYLAASSSAQSESEKTATTSTAVPSNAVDGVPTKPVSVTTGDSSRVSTGSSSQTSEATTSSSGTTVDANKNLQVPRDVMDCSKFQELTKDSAFSPEKIILAGSGVMAPETFCEQQKKSAAALTTACSAADSDKGAASAATGILAMINSFCDKTSPKVLVDMDSKCDGSIKKATTACLPKSVLAGVVTYPSDLLIMMMKESNSTAVCNAKTCISSEMQKGTCPADQQKTILAPLDALAPTCAAGTDTSTTASPSGTTAIPSASTTTPAGPASTTTKSGRSSASTIQTNLLIALLPVSVLFFKF